MLLASFPVAFVDPVVFPLKLAVPVLLVVLKLPNVLLLIRPCLDPDSMHMTMYPLSYVGAAISKGARADAVHCVLLPSAGIL